MSHTASQIDRINQNRAAIRIWLDHLVDHAREHIESGTCRTEGCPGLAVAAALKAACHGELVALLAQAVTRLAKTEGPRP